ncbi:MAG: hypothetical protein JXA57_08875 [Armatimonadetes bacterium]|nr:hypothetical protein [Armatimonadota bacterium]
MRSLYWCLSMVLVVIVTVLMLLSTGATASSGGRFEGGHLDDPTRAELVASCLQSGDYATAYYHAAWLTWLSASLYAESDGGAGVLRNRSIRDRAARSRPDDMLPITLAVEAEQLVYGTCLNGAIAQQSTRLHRDLEALRVRAERAASESAPRDPIVRLALARLSLTLDSVMMFEVTKATDQERISVLRTAASRAGAVADWRPDAPGAHRLLAIIRARLAEIDNHPAQWQLAIKEATRAFELDPTDRSLAEMLWVLHLRAGNWDEARKWQRQVETMSASCVGD